MKAKIYQFEDYAVEVVHDPANHLSRDLQDELVAECTELSRDSFGNTEIKESFVRRCLFSSSVLLFGRDHSGQLFGYSSNSCSIVENYNIIYLKSMTILREFQGRGLRNLLFSIKILEDINKIRKNNIESSQILLATRTQNPLIFKSVSRHLGLFPQPNGVIDPIIKNIGKKFVYQLNDICHTQNDKQTLFDDQHFVERGAYKSVTQTSTNGVYPAGIPYCRDDHEINDYMNQHLDWQNGDALILLGYYRDDIVKQMFEDAKHRMGFQDVYEIAPEELAAIAA